MREMGVGVRLGAEPDMQGWEMTWLPIPMGAVTP